MSSRLPASVLLAVLPALALGGPTRSLPLTLDTDGGLSSTEEAALTAQVRSALDFVLEQGGWSQPATVSQVPVRVLVMALGRGVTAQTSGPNEIRVSPRALAIPSLPGVLAHELTHLVDFRVAGGNGLVRAPRYLVEGRGFTLGRERRRVLKVDADDPERTQLIVSLTGDDAAETVAKYRDGSGFRELRRERKYLMAAATSVFFIEFLRVHGYPDVIRRLTRTLEQVGTGADFDPAFASHFGGRPLSALEADFVRFIRSTEGHPEERLRGTVYARFLSSASP